MGMNICYKAGLRGGKSRASGVTPALTHFPLTLCLSLRRDASHGWLVVQPRPPASLASICTLSDALFGPSVYFLVLLFIFFNFFSQILIPCEPPAASFDNCADSLKELRA